MANQKSASTTFILNFLVPGVGHLYASGGKRAGPLAINIVCAVLGAVIYFPWLGNLIIWIYTMVTSSSVTDEYNAAYLNNDEDLSWRREEAQRRTREAQARRAIEETGRKHQREETERIEATQVRGGLLASQLAKVQTLVSAGVLEKSEGDAERAKIISSCLGGWTTEDKLTFLGPFAELLNQSTLAANDMQAVKNLYAALAKERPEAEVVLP
jgi:hypothetical protein